MLSKLKSIPRIYRTVKHLKPIQILYQVKNRLWKSGSLKQFRLPLTSNPSNLLYFELPDQRNVLTIEEDYYIFDLLNLKNKYSKEIDWNDQSNGKLWNYNMQYCDFLRQNNLKIEKRAGVLLLLYEKLWKGGVQVEPYPASLRIMNVIRFLSQYPEEQPAVIDYLHAEVHYLSKNLEYHLLGNHLLENAFAYLMGAYFFSNEKWKSEAESLVKREMDEQILEDGAHFERSPMYHQIMLFRVLEAIAYLPKEDPLRGFLIAKAENMMAWLSTMTFLNGSIPHFNDSTDNIAYTTKNLMQLATNIDIQEKSNHYLKDSGYRKFSVGGYEMFIDVHGIGPDYQPGHAHADTFTFFLSMNGRPLIVEPGITTYEIGPSRNWERGTDAHNTVSVQGQNSSETWSGFRVGRRANVTISDDKDFLISAYHDGYKHFGIMVHRQFSIDHDRIFIEDYLEGWDSSMEAVSYLHFHPSAEVRMQDHAVILNGQIEIRFIGSQRLMLENYPYSNGYNSTEIAQRLRITLLEPSCITQIKPIL